MAAAARKPAMQRAKDRPKSKPAAKPRARTRAKAPTRANAAKPAKKPAARAKPAASSKRQAASRKPVASSRSTAGQASYVIKPAARPVALRASLFPPAANRQSTLPSSSRGFRVSRGAAAAGASLGGLGWLLAGAALLFAVTRKSSAAPALPSPTTDPAAPKVPGVEPTIVKPTIPVSLTDAQKLAAEYRRAKTSELPRDVLARAPGFLTLPMGAISFFDSSDGRQFAAVLEEHFHSAESGLKPVGKHKGVSMFIKREA